MSGCRIERCRIGAPCRPASRSHLGTRFTFLYPFSGYPPPPLRAQNLKNKRFILSLCARSLSLQELHAKSREHRSYGRSTRCPGSRSGTCLGTGEEQVFGFSGLWRLGVPARLDPSTSLRAGSRDARPPLNAQSDCQRSVLSCR